MPRLPNNILRLDTRLLIFRTTMKIRELKSRAFKPWRHSTAATIREKKEGNQKRGSSTRKTRKGDKRNRFDRESETIGCSSPRGNSRDSFNENIINLTRLQSTEKAKEEKRGAAARIAIYYTIYPAIATSFVSTGN